MMRLTLRAVIVAGLTAVGGLLATISPAHAGGCCGGGAAKSFPSRAAYSSAPRAGSGSSCCQMGGMAMSGMAMAAPVAAPQNGMAGMTAAAPATAPAAGSQYYCPMHPTVASAGPATCPYCQMALKKR